MEGQRGMAEQVSVMEAIPGDTTEYQMQGGCGDSHLGEDSLRESTEGWSCSPVQKAMVLPAGHAWSWSPFQPGMSSYHSQSEWSWSPISNFQQRYYGRWSWSPSQLKILPYSNQEETDVPPTPGQPPVTAVNCWPIFVDTYRSKRKRIRKRKSRKRRPYNHKRERNWKTLSCVTKLTQEAEESALLSPDVIKLSQDSQNAKHCGSYSCATETRFPSFHTQRPSNTWSQREGNSPHFMSTVDGVPAKSASPVSEIKAEENSKFYLEKNEMQSKSPAPVSKTVKMKEYPGIWQMSVSETEKSNEGENVSSVFEVDGEGEKRTNSPLVFEHDKLDELQTLMERPVSKTDDTSEILTKCQLPLFEDDRNSDVETNNLSAHIGNETEKLQAESFSEKDEVNNIQKETLLSQSKSDEMKCILVNDSPSAYDANEMIEMQENISCLMSNFKLNEVTQTNKQTSMSKVKKVFQMHEKNLAHESGMAGSGTKSPLHEIKEVTELGQPQTLLPVCETDQVQEKSLSISDRDEHLLVRTDEPTTNKAEHLLPDHGADEKGTCSLSSVPTLKTPGQGGESRSPSPVDKLISGGLGRSLSIELLDTSGGIHVNAEGLGVGKHVRPSTIGPSDDLMSPQHPKSLSSVMNSLNLKDRISSFYEKYSTASSSECTSVNQDVVKVSAVNKDAVLEVNSVKIFQEEDIGDTMIHYENESRHSSANHIVQGRSGLRISAGGEGERIERQDILPLGEGHCIPQGTLTRTRTLTLPCTTTDNKPSSVPTSDGAPVYERFGFKNDEELELVSMKNSTSSLSNEENTSALQKDSLLQTRPGDIFKANKDSVLDSKYDTTENAALLQQNMAPSSDSEAIIAQSGKFFLGPRSQVKCSTTASVSTEPKNPSPAEGPSSRWLKSPPYIEGPSPRVSRSPSSVKGSSPRASRSPSPVEGSSPRVSRSPSSVEGPSPRVSRSPSPAEEPSPRVFRSPSPAKGSSSRVSRSPSLAEGFSPRVSRSPSPAEGPSPRASRSPSPVEGPSPRVSRSPSPAEGPSPRVSRSPSSVKGSSPRASRSPSPVEGPSPRVSRSPSPAEGPSPRVSRSPSPAEGPSPRVSRSPSSVKGSSPRASRSPSPVEGPSPRVSRSPSPAEGPSPRVSRSPSPAEGPSPRVSRSPSPAEGPSPRVSRSPSSAEGPSPPVCESPSPAKEPSPRVSRSPSSAEGPSPQVSRSSSPAEGPSPRVSRSPSPAEGPSPRVSRSPSPAEGPSPRVYRSSFPAEGTSPRVSRSSSPAEGPSPRVSRSPSPAEGPSPRVSRSPSPAEGPSPRVSRSPSPAEGPSPRVYRSPSPAEGPSPRVSRSSSPAEGPSPRVSRSPSPAEGPSPRVYRSSFPAEGTSPRVSRSSSPAEGPSPRVSRSSSPAEGPSPRVSRSSSPAEGPSPRVSRSPSPAEGPSPRVSRSSSPAERPSPRVSRSPSPAEGPSPRVSRSSSPAERPSPRVSRSPSPAEGPSPRVSRSSSPAERPSPRVSRSPSLAEGPSPRVSRSPSPAEGPSPRVSRSSSPAERPSPRVPRSPSPAEGPSPRDSRRLSPAEEPSPRVSRSPSPIEGPSPRISRSPFPAKEPSSRVFRSPSGGGSHFPDNNSPWVVGEECLTLRHTEVADVLCNASSCRIFLPTVKTRELSPQSDAVNIGVHTGSFGKPSGEGANAVNIVSSGVKRKHSACFAGEAVTDNSQQWKKPAIDQTEILSALLEKIRGESLPESPTSHRTVCHKNVVTRAVTRRLAHRSPNHNLHHVAEARMEIFDAVESGDFEKVRELMQDTGPAVRRKNTHCTLLHEAANHRQVDMVLFLLRFISPNVVNKEGFTPAHLAARKGHTQILRLLLADSEMDPNKRDTSNNTYKHWLTLPLLEAVLEDSRARVQELLRLGADPDQSMEPPADILAARDLQVTTARQLAYTLQRDNILPLFKRKCVADDSEGVKDGAVGVALQGLQLPEENKGMDKEVKQLVNPSPVQVRGPDVYRMDTTPRGYVCILSYSSFQDRRDLHLEGSQTDAHNLANVFNKMGYSGHAHFSLTANQTRQQLAKVRDMELLERAGCAVFVISSHGEPGRHFLTSDMQTIDIQWVLDLFKDSQCPHLKNKPKLFIWDFCRGHQEEESSRGNTQGELCGRVDEPLRDVVCLDSSSGGFTWHAFSKEGTPFIRALCSILARHAPTKELTELYREFLKEYTTAAPDAVPQLINYGFNKRFYFN